MRATDVILLVLGICLLGIAFLVWQNRGSEKIMSAVIPAGFAAAAAILLPIQTLRGHIREASRTLGSRRPNTNEGRLPY